MGAVIVLVGLATPASGSRRDQLRFIVQQQCLPHWHSSSDPTPCVSVSLVDKGRGSGFALLADQKGGAHYLLIPTDTITGIESPDARAPGALNYFEAAWQAREVLASAVGHGVPRTAVGMAVNQIRSRSQDQLHIHLSCLGRQVYETLGAQAEHIGMSWAPLRIGGSQYYAMRVAGADLDAANPFALLAERLPGAIDSMGEFTMLVAGMQFRDGPGFAILAGADVPGAELLLDSSCAVTGP
jgi:CDP-diacylglycerol pyrophosphatase